MKGKVKKCPKINQVWRKKRPPPPPWIELPRDLTANILQRLGAVDILESAQKVCMTWRSVCKDHTFWSVIDMYNLGDLFDMPYDLDIMCRHAVDRSQGQAIDINIEYFGSEDLLEYIAERCNQLRKLRISCCYGGISGEALSKFPLLEELHLTYTHISNESLDMVGPQLKSFSLNSRGFRYPDDDYHEEYDEDALIIAKSMPELRHLQLIGNSLTNKGLQAILDGCPHLESLDLRRCLCLDLTGDLGKRCSQQMKNVRLPRDSTAGCVFSYDEW